MLHLNIPTRESLTSLLDQVNAFPYEVKTRLVKICCNITQEEGWHVN